MAVSLPPSRALLTALLPCGLLALGARGPSSQDSSQDVVQPGASDAGLEFTRDLQPVFAEHCGSCHGARRQRAGLRLDTLAGLRAGSEYGPIVESGDAEASALVRVLRLPLEHELHMPPADREQLSEEELELVERWVRSDPAELRGDLPPALARPDVDASSSAPPPEFVERALPVLETHCYGCHGAERQEAGLRLDVLDADLERGSDGPVWRHALDLLNAGVMPPSDAPQPSDDERRALVAWLTDALERAALARAGSREPVLRRLTRAQLTHTLTDLLGFEMDFGRDLPADARSRMGFTNSGDAQETAPLHLESIEAIARAALDAAIAVGERPEAVRFRVTFGTGVGADSPAAEVGGYQAVPLARNDFLVEVLGDDGRPLAEDADVDLAELRERIGVGLRGSSHSRFRVIEDGLVLYGARPHVERAPASWQGPSPNVKLELKRCFPDRGPLRMTVRASRGRLFASDRLQLVDVAAPVARVRPFPTDTSSTLLAAAPDARVLDAHAGDQLENLVTDGERLVPAVRTEPCSARFEVQMDEPGHWQVDLVHPPLPADAMPSVRLTVGAQTLDRRLEPTAEELAAERMVTGLGVAYLPAGTHELRVGGPFFVGFESVVLTPLPEQHPALAPFTRASAELAERVATLTPGLRVFAGTRTDDGMDYATFGEHVEVHSRNGVPQAYTFHARLEDLPVPEPESGDTEILSGYLLLGLWNDHLVKTPGDPGPPLLVHSIEVEAPYHPVWPPPSHTRIFFESPNQEDRETYTAEVVARFAERAFRRPLAPGELERYLAFWSAVQDDVPTYEEGVREVLVAILCSPSFLFLAEPEEHAVSEHELASRLSYFLWNSAPDDELLGLAASGRLRTELGRQAVRLLDDPRVERFARAFAEEWLRLDRHAERAVDVGAYPDYTRFVKRDMAEETHRFLSEVLARDESLLTLVDSPFAMLNQNLAEFYGVPGVEGAHFRRVELDPAAGRGGLLSHGAFLVGHSDGRQPHPIRRAVWLKERILGEPPPPPPPNVPELDSNDPELAGLTLKQQLEAHRDRASCRDCHTGIDPYGVVFERYDAVGRRRTELAGEPIDASTVLPDGTELDGVAALKRHLVEAAPERVARGVIEHLFAFAVGRDVHPGDRAELAAILERARSNEYRMRAVIAALVESPSFSGS